MKSAVNNDYWNSAYNSLALRYNEDSILFKELFSRYCKKGGSVFEVGCYPGNYLIYLGTNYNYIVNGIDQTPYIETRLPEYLANYDVKVGNLHHGDFLTYAPDDKFDVVCSFGFIEHFTDIQKIFRLHLRLVKPGGLLIISSPNFRKVQYLLHRILDSENLDRHILANMDKDLWIKMLHNLDANILYCDYYKTVDFWIDLKNQNLFKECITKGISKLCSIINKNVNWPNSYISPYLICIAQRKEEVV